MPMPNKLCHTQKCIQTMSGPKITIAVAAIVSPFVTVFQLVSSVCILHSLKPSNRRRGHYTYYLELANGTRSRQMADVVYDERQEQIIFFHAFLIAFVLPGFLMPYLLWAVSRKSRHNLLVWWICWITLHNAHALMGLLTYSLNLAIAIYNRELFSFGAHFCAYWNFFNICSLGSTLNTFVAPFTTFLSVYLLRFYQNLKGFPPMDVDVIAHLKVSLLKPVLDTKTSSFELLNAQRKSAQPL
uniref:G-protein coupled receptors family 1 profile domain-containing protein n=1 Tax=Globodera rostochiensis TaxID=31243 RepID=A0A914I4I5_GLORO